MPLRGALRGVVLESRPHESVGNGLIMAISSKPVPTSDDLQRSVLRMIREGEYHPGERIGSERALAVALGVSRERLRQALDELEREHVVRRATGRTGGIFADDGRLQRRLNTIEGVPALLRQQGRQLETRVIHCRVALASPYERRALGLQPGQGVIFLLRARFVDGESWSLESSTLPAERFPGLPEADLSHSLYGILHKDFGVQPTVAKETLDVRYADAEQAHLLRVHEGHALVEIWRTTYDQSDLPFEIGHDFFRGDRTRIHTRSYGANWKRATPSHSKPRESQC